MISSYLEILFQNLTAAVLGNYNKTFKVWCKKMWYFPFENTFLEINDLYKIYVVYNVKNYKPFDNRKLEEKLFKTL